MVSNTIGCSNGKTTLIDPNLFAGQSSANNRSVPLEDLSIVVELNATKIPRTVLTSSGTIGTASNQAGVRVSFLDGSHISGTDKKYLTTKYTDVFHTPDKESDNSENLGITDIDIDFNSQQMPMVTIKFVDVRGSAIFQNEQQVAGGNNKYAIFFQLPYPLFNLTIKGYYGQAVTYCLHLYKFTSRFNSQTGNFEITASFVGYTYAMFSDMLIGHLKAIEYTSEGKKKYDELKAANPNLITLDELMVAVSQINENLKKLSASDPELKQIQLGNNSIQTLGKITDSLINLGAQIDYNTNLPQYPYIIANTNLANKQNQNGLTPVQIYNVNIKSLIDNYNTTVDTSLQLSVSDYTLPQGSNVFQNVTLADLKSVAPTNNLSGLDNEAKQIIVSYIKSNNYSLNDTQQFTLYINSGITSNVAKQTLNITNQQENHKLALAQSLRNQIKANLGFDPTIRNIINVFTTAIEVFMSVLWKVSKDAESQGNPSARVSELKKAFNEAESHDLQLGSKNSGAKPKYYAWPDYRRFDEKDGYIEDYLGNAPNITNPLAINELAFIEDFLMALLKPNKYSNNTQKILTQIVETWYPVNPIDTGFFVSEQPYTRIDGKSADEVTLLVLLRAITFLGYSNRNLSDDEINNMANAEADAVYSQLQNRNIFKILNGNLSSGNNVYNANAYINSIGVINGLNTKVLDTNNAGDYVYRYIFNTQRDGDIRAIPINQKFNSNTWQISENGLLGMSNDTPASLFVTNYDYNGTIQSKPQDGGVYITILDPQNYSNSTAQLPTITSGVQVKNTAFNLGILSGSNPNKDSAFNTMNGGLGIQEFKLVDLNDSDLKAQPYRFIFYDITTKTNNVSINFNKSNGLGLKRGYSIDGTLLSNTKRTGGYVTTKTTPYDFTGTTFNAIKNVFDYSNFVDENGSAIHNYYGDNYLLASKYLNSSSVVTYPYINFQVYYRDNLPRTTIQMAPVSLFGSRLYYEQTDERGKALLFLHTFPWKGLNSLRNGRLDGIFENVGNQEILNTFSYRAGFISAPKLWVAFIGGLLTRYDETKDIINFHNGTESFIPTFGNSITSDNYPSKSSYLTVIPDYDETPPVSMSFYFPDTNNPHSINNSKYKPLDIVLLSLPDQAKIAFKAAFTNFVGGDWTSIKQQLELVDTSTGVASAIWKSTYDALTFTNTNNVVTCQTSQIQNGYTNTSNYSIVAPMVSDTTLGGDPNFKYNICLEIKDGSNIAIRLVDYFINEQSIISNSTYRIWVNSSDTTPRNEIVIPKDALTKYMNTFVNNIQSSNKSNKDDSDKKQAEVTLFGTNDEKEIKFQLYRTCKNIYDKWIAGTTEEDRIMFRCGNKISNVTTSLAKRRGDTQPRLIDSFRFVSRSFKDIGDDLAVNPTPVLNYLAANQDASSYDAITNLLSSNNFTFNPLPSFIDYRDPNILKTVFKPIGKFEIDPISNAKNSCFPTFVCTYLGQSSKHLDFNDNNYPNDGFDARCLNGTLVDVPKDFSLGENTYEDPVTFFKVDYGQQNQNIFKDVTIDQAEFGETAEFLYITDAISKKGGEKNATLGGQNIYNVHAVRSYNVEIEMMGNAMIQPMMYFQLNNIPMFHGAYMITRVKHNVRANHMTTHISGSRIRKPETKILDVSSMYMSMLDTLDNINATTTNTNGSKFSPTVSNPSTGSSATRPPKQGISCSVINKNSINFSDVLKLVVNNLEGAYCAGGIACGSQNSGETLWGLDRINHTGSLDNSFWGLVDSKNKNGWNQTKFPKPNDLPDVYDIYVNIFKKDYDTFSKTYITNQTLKDIIESDGRLYFNMIYAVYNGAGFFSGFAKLLQNAFNNGQTTSDGLLSVFVNERVVGGQNAFTLGTTHKLDTNSATLIANTGVDIQKLVGVGPECNKTMA